MNGLGHRNGLEGTKFAPSNLSTMGGQGVSPMEDVATRRKMSHVLCLDLGFTSL